MKHLVKDEVFHCIEVSFGMILPLEKSSSTLKVWGYLQIHGSYKKLPGVVVNQRRTISWHIKGCLTTRRKYSVMLAVENANPRGEARKHVYSCPY